MKFDFDKVRVITLNAKKKGKGDSDNTGNTCRFLSKNCRRE